MWRLDLLCLPAAVKGDTMSKSADRIKAQLGQQMAMSLSTG